MKNDTSKQNFDSNSQSDYIVVQSVDEEELKLHEKINSIMHEISKIIMHHQYIVDDCIYGENSITKLLASNPELIKFWPEPQLCLLNQSSKTAQVIEYYDSLFKTMMHEYIAHAISMGDILSYNEIAKHENIIDITKFHDRSEDSNKTTDLDIIFYEDEVDTMRLHSWKIFIPCYNDMVVKINKKRYFHIILKNSDEQNKCIELELKDYIGDKYDWNCSASATLKLSYQDESNEGLPCKWEIIKSESYETFVLKYLNAFEWTKEKKQLWFDILGINEASELTLVKCTFSEPEDKTFQTLIRTRSDLQKLQKLKLPSAKFKIITQGDEVLSYHDNESAKKMFIRYNKIVTFINMALYGITDTITVDDINNNIPAYILSRKMIIENDKTKKIDKLIIKSKNEPQKHSKL